MRLIAAATGACLLISGLVTFEILRAHPNTSFNEIAIEPRPGSAATVSADGLAELSQVAASGGQLLIAEIAGDTVAAPALDTEVSCQPGTNALICEQQTAGAVRTATNVIYHLAASPAPAELDIFATFQQAVGYLSENHVRHQAINLWINTTGGQLRPDNLVSLTSSSNLKALARSAVGSGAFPGPGQCAGFHVHMVVPPMGSPEHQLGLRELFTTLINGCGGTLASWTARWIASNPNSLPLPAIPGVHISQRGRSLSYTLSEALDDFPVGSSALTALAYAALKKIAAEIQARAPKASVTCTGSTDGTGTTAFDHALSKRRAAVVCTYLASQGISRKMIRIIAAGKATPSAADPRLRRVTITVSAR